MDEILKTSLNLIIPHPHSLDSAKIGVHLLLGKTVISFGKTVFLSFCEETTI